MLKYYSVDASSGKVTRKRKPSPAATGCFLAHHSNRYYCGKTGQTWLFTGKEESA